MALSEKEIFKIGFLLKCANDGLTMEETHLRVKQAISNLKRQKEREKQAFNLLAPAAWLGGKAMDLGGAVVKSIPNLLSTLGVMAVGAPLVAGGTTGYLAAKATGGGGESKIEDAKQDEIIGEYDRLAEEARRRAKLKKLQQQTGRRIVALTPGQT